MFESFVSARWRIDVQCSLIILRLSSIRYAGLKMIEEQMPADCSSAGILAML
jgi:hypothetical protein